MTRTEFLRGETLYSRNKTARRPLPDSFSTQDLDCGLCERKALATKMIFDNMPIQIYDRELIVGLRTFYRCNPGNEDGHDIFAYKPNAHPPYVNDRDIGFFGFDHSFRNKAHYTPDYGILLEKGIDGIISSAKNNIGGVSNGEYGKDFLRGVIAAYTGLSDLISRYSSLASSLASKEADAARKNELETIAKVCENIAHKPASTFQEAVQLLWFGQIGAMCESFQFINYGRVDVILGKYLGDTDYAKASQLIDCLLLKMYDQVDLDEDYTQKYAAQLNITLGGVDENGNDAVNPVTYMFLDGIGRVRLPEPEVSLRINSKNPPDILKKAAALTVGGINSISYYNDDQFIKNLISAGVKPEYARCYGFDLCQDINIPGKGDYFSADSYFLVEKVMDTMHAFPDGCDSFDTFMKELKHRISEHTRISLGGYIRSVRGLIEFGKGNTDFYFEGIQDKVASPSPEGHSPMAPLPFLSALYEGCIEQATDLNLHPIPDKNVGAMIGCVVEGVNSLAAIKLYCFDKKEYTVPQILRACEENYEGNEELRQKLFNAPKWGNDDDYVDLIAKDIIEFGLKEINKYETPDGGKFLAGVHQPHPVSTGHMIAATPDGRKNGTPVAVTMTPANGTLKNGATAAFKSVAKLDNTLCQWNFCMMLTYYSSVFGGSNGVDLFEHMLRTYFSMGGLQHQPNVLDISALKDAQEHPERYKDLIVRLWGVSAHFVDLPRELQDEIIARAV